MATGSEASALLAATREVVADPGGLHSFCYCDPGFFNLERERFLAKSWLCIGLTGDVPEPGDVRPLEFLGRALILARDGAGLVRVFQNSCRHRGHPVVVKAASGRRRLVCPYHSWSYRLDGRLDAAPHADLACLKGAATCSDREIGLLEVRSAVWHGILFVNLSGDAPDFADHIRPLETRWADYDLTQLRHGESLAYEAQTNWKLAIENFVDYYHLPSVHKGLNSYSDMGDHYPIEEGTLFLGQGNRNCNPRDEATGCLPTFPGLPVDRMLQTEALWFSPNLLITIFSDNLRIIIVEPVHCGLTRERVEVFFIGAAASDPAFSELRRTAVARFEEFNAEDLEVIERLQVGLQTADFDGGNLVVDYDNNVRRFQRTVLEAILAG